MAIVKKQTGRPSKGPRDTFNVKLPVGYGEKIRGLADTEGLTYQDFLAPLIIEAVDRYDFDANRGQEPLIQRAS